MVELNPAAVEKPEEEYKREPHHKDAKEGLSFMQIQMQYEQAVREAVSIMICHYSSLNMAIDLGFSGRK